MGQTTDILTLLLQGAGAATPVLALMWHLLNSLKLSVESIKTEVKDLQIQLAKDESPVHIKNLRESLLDIKRDHKEFHRDLVLTTSKVDAAWRHLDSQPKSQC